MARFIELKRSGSNFFGNTIFVNVETIETVFHIEEENKTRVCFTGDSNDYIDVDDGYDEVKRLVIGEEK